ncbi:hypothetical protein ABZ297_25795 [Nonomuraea sp. NPDC005983]|uniref:effector-associated constant component EACC1 n=1 Tax=Nonomuraea sp. NPDC005983 TaxID=3155595 RepID=UPI0033A2CEA1
MTANITVVARGTAAGDDARGLRDWLVAEDELAGRVKLSEGTPEPDRLGVPTDVIMLMLAPGGAVTAFSAAVITWIRHRTGTATITIRREDRTEVKISAQRVRALDGQALTALTRELGGWLEGEPGRPPLRELAGSDDTADQ